MNHEAADASQCYLLDDLTLDLRRRSVHRGETEIALPRRSFELFAALVRAAPAPISTEALIDAVWDGRVVEPATVAKRVELLRLALGDDSKRPRYVALERGFGYRLVPEPQLEPQPPLQDSDDDAAVQTVPRRAGLAAIALLVAAAAALYVALAHRDPAPDAGAPPDSIAVLPFRTLSPDAQDELLARGLTEELRHELSRNGDLRVAGRTSSDYFDDDRGDLRAVGQALRVASLLDGSVRRSGDKVRITAQLVNVADGFQLWSHAYDREVRDVLAIQRDIARSVSQRLRGTPTQAAVDLTESPRPNPEAYAMYLEAVSLSPYGAGGDLERAQALIEQVLARDPDYAPAWNRLGAIHGRRIAYRDPTYALTPQQGLALAIDATKRAIELNPDAGEAYANLAGAAWVFEGDVRKAAPLVERAIALEPWNLDLLSFGADFAKYIGRVEMSLALEQRIVQRDPLCTTCRAALARSYLFAGRYADAEREYRTVRAAEGGGRLWSIGISELLQGHADDALASFEEMRNEDYLDYLALQGQALALHDLGRTEASRELVSALIEQWRDEAPVEIAQTLAYTGRIDDAFDWLERALPQKSFDLQSGFQVPLFEPLHDDPRWRDILRRIDRAPEQLATIDFQLDSEVAR